MKRIISMITLIMLTLSTSAWAETPAPGRELNCLDALGISSRGDIISGYMMSIDKQLAMNLTNTQLDDFYDAAEIMTLNRRLVKNPFTGMCIVLNTYEGEKVYNFSSGVQIGKFGDDNFLCYCTAEENETLDGLYTRFMSSNDKFVSSGVPVNNTDYFIFPENQWAVEDAMFGASTSLLPYEVAECFGLLLSRERFCILVGNFIAVQGNYADLSGFLKDRNMAYLANYFNDTAGCDHSINMLHALGIVNGVADNSFRPGDPLTREQAAVIIMKTAQLLGIDGEPAKAQSFTDKKLISSWAADAVNFVSTNGIMTGTDGKFQPLEYITTEQAVAGINKLYKLAN